MSLNFTKEEFLKNNFKTTVLYKKIPTDTLTAVASHIKLTKHFSDYNFLLESAENGNNKGRFSVIGINPDKIWKCINGEALINQNFAK